MLNFILGKFWLIIVAQITSIQQNEFCIFNDIVSFMSCLQQDAIKRRKILYVVLWKIKAVYFAEVVWSKHNVLFKQCNTTRSRTTLPTGMIDMTLYLTIRYYGTFQIQSTHYEIRIQFMLKLRNTFFRMSCSLQNTNLKIDTFIFCRPHVFKKVGNLHFNAPDMIGYIYRKRAFSQ